MQTATPAKPRRSTARTELENLVSEAKENHQYWRRQAAIRSHPAGVDEARGLAAAWKHTLASREARLEESAKH
jgi:hypothetical protein